MTQMIVKHKNLRGITVDENVVYYCSASAMAVHMLHRKSKTETAVRLSQATGAVKKQGKLLYCGSYSAANPCIFLLGDTFKTVRKINYLKSVPPKFLPARPHEGYVTGLAAKDDRIYMTLQNGGYIIELSGDGTFIRADSVDTDTAGIDFDGENLYTVNLSSGIVKKNHRLLHALPVDFHPFDIACHGDKLFITSSVSDKIAVLDN